MILTGPNPFHDWNNDPNVSSILDGAYRKHVADSRLINDILCGNIKMGCLNNPVAAQLIENMNARDQEQRPSIAEVLDHLFFKEGAKPSMPQV